MRFYQTLKTQLVKWLKKKADRSQADKISAWITEEVEENDLAWVTILNESNKPVTKLIISTVNIQNKPTSGRETPDDHRCYIGLLPPGKYFARLLTHRGMNFLSGVELSFIDSSGQTWIRQGDGELLAINKSPEQYYNLDLPISWEVPMNNINKP